MESDRNTYSYLHQAKINPKAVVTNQYDILVVEDHDLIVKGIMQILQYAPDLNLADAVDTAEKALALLESRNYDVYILDIELPGEVSGIQLINHIRKKNPRARIIMSTMHEEVWILNQLIRLKVNGIILKSSASIHLVSALNSVLMDMPYTCPHFDKIKEQLENEDDNSLIRKEPTRREKEVLQAMANGLKTSEIAVKLGVSENTVETFRKRLIQKFNAKNATDLIVLAIKQGWVDIC